MKIRHLRVIMGKELKGYFNSPLAYIFITVFLVLTSWLFFRGFFLNNQASMRAYFALIPWFFIIFIPAITMRLWSEEQKAGTIEILFTSPVTEWDAVIGKFMASLTFLLITLLCSAIIPAALYFVGHPDIGAILGGYLGVMFLGAAFLSIGLWISTLTQNQIIAFILSVLLMFVLFILGEPLVLHTTPPQIVPIFKYIGMGVHFQSIGRGVIDSRDLIYYFLFTLFFLYLSVTSLRSNKWH